MKGRGLKVIGASEEPAVYFGEAGFLARVAEARADGIEIPEVFCPINRGCRKGKKRGMGCNLVTCANIAKAAAMEGSFGPNFKIGG